MKNIETKTFTRYQNVKRVPRIKSYVCVSGGKKCSFFGKFGVLCLLETPILRFALLPYYRRNDLSVETMGEIFAFHEMKRLTYRVIYI